MYQLHTCQFNLLPDAKHSCFGSPATVIHVILCEQKSPNKLFYVSSSHICFYLIHLLSITKCIYVCFILQMCQGLSLRHFFGTTPQIYVSASSHTCSRVCQCLCVSAGLHLNTGWCCGKLLYLPPRSAETLLCSAQKISGTFVPHYLREVVKKKNDRRNSGGTLRQKFNLNDI